MQDLKRILLSARQDKMLQSIADRFFWKINSNSNSNFVTCKSFIPSPGDNPAFSTGNTFLHISRGSIYVSKSLFNFLKTDELSFIILHEMAHIYYNHIPLTQATIFVKETPIALITQPLKIPYKDIRESISNLELLFRFFTRQRTLLDTFKAKKEMKADRFAILIMKNKDPAISCLVKLSQGNIKMPSHVSKEGNFQIPVITYEQRINGIEHYFKNIFCPNCQRKSSWNTRNDTFYCHHCRQYFKYK